MKFFYADSLDLVDPSFDFDADRSMDRHRVPQRDDVYAHELMHPEKPYDGLLVSRALFRVGGGSVASGKYSQAQRTRFEREGARRFLRFPIDGVGGPADYPIMGDCGAFAYRNEPEPPLSVSELIEFYVFGGFTHGISLDHVVLAYNEALDREDPAQSSLPGFASAHRELYTEVRRRQQLSLDNADEFYQRCFAWKVDFEPLGAAHGWSPRSYQESVRQLLRMGYSYIALGGMVPLKNRDVEVVLRAVREVTGGHVRLHLLGIVRPPLYGLMSDVGVASFDSSSPVWQAFKDARNNYYSSYDDGHYVAVRVPQSDLGLVMRRIREGRISQAKAIAAESQALESLRDWGDGTERLENVLEALRQYDELLGEERKTRTPWDAIERTLRDRPWESCPCPICREIGINVVLFRGANRNRRRGFHNLWWTQNQLERWREEQAG